MHILLEASKMKDERSKKGATAEELLGEGIRLAEAHHFKEAKERIAQYIKTNPRSHKGWLWYSRITVNVKTIGTALANAAKLSPNSTEIIEEIKRFKLAKERFGDAQQVRRCPFCWFPMQINAIQCHVSFLQISSVHPRQFFLFPGRG
jgi:twitching motility two-component system response regulator PilG